MAHILVVDDEEVLRDLLSQILETMDHTCEQAANGVEGCRLVESTEYDLIITDIRMPEMGGLDFLRRIEPHVESRTPCMIITALADEPSIAVKAVRLACDFLSKPFEVRTIQRAVQRALKLREAWKFRQNYQEHLETELCKKETELRQTHDGTLIGFAAMLEGKDTTTAEHCERLRWFCSTVAKEMGLEDPVFLRNLDLGAMLHDIGKYRVPDHILHKPGALTDDEWAEMRKHPEWGADFVKHIPFLAEAEDVILNHHERWDGQGYPRGLKAQEIPLAARIFFVVDAFDAMCEKRCYKDARPPAEALDEIRANAGVQFDPTVVAAFERVYDDLVRCQPAIREAAKNGANGHAGPHGEPSLDELATELRRRVAEETRLALSGDSGS